MLTPIEYVMITFERTFLLNNLQAVAKVGPNLMQGKPIHAVLALVVSTQVFSMGLLGHLDCRTHER